MLRYLRFNGHPPTKQSLASEGESTFLPGVGEWKHGEPKVILDDLALYLLTGVNGTYQVFTELTEDEFTKARAEWDDKVVHAETPQLPPETTPVPDAPVTQDVEPQADTTEPPDPGVTAEGAE